MFRLAVLYLYVTAHRGSGPVVTSVCAPGRQGIGGYRQRRAVEQSLYSFYLDVEIFP